MAKQTKTKWVAGFEWSDVEPQVHEVTCVVRPQTLIVAIDNPARSLLGYGRRFDIADTRFSDSRDEALKRCAAKLQSAVTAAEQNVTQLKAKLSRVKAVISGEKAP
jgi:hypothetical protein